MKERTLVCSRVIILPILKELEELLGSPLLEQTHEGTPDCFHLGTRDLGDPTITIDETSSNLLEFEVSGDISVDEDPRELSRCDDELGDEIDSIITVATQFSRRCLIWSEFTVELWVVSECMQICLDRNAKRGPE